MLLTSSTCALVSLLGALASVFFPLAASSGTQLHLDAPIKALEALELSVKEYRRCAVELYTDWFDKCLRNRSRLMYLIRCTKVAQYNAARRLVPVVIFLRGHHLAYGFTTTQLSNSLAWAEALYSSTLNDIRCRITTDPEFVLDRPQKMQKCVLDGILCRETEQGQLKLSLVTIGGLEIIELFSKLYYTTLARSTLFLEAKRLREQEGVPRALAKKHLVIVSLPRLAMVNHAYKTDYSKLIQALDKFASVDLEASLLLHRVIHELLPLVTEYIALEELKSIIKFAKGSDPVV